jgi:pimeloyl-ACP methyl ester carboxylesterase
MRLAYEQVADRIEVSQFHLTGYSLGAWQAAFVAQLDEQEKVFGFGKVLLVNPPVSLYSSIRILDDLLDKNIPGGPDQFNASNFSIGLGWKPSPATSLWRRSSASRSACRPPA